MGKSAERILVLAPWNDHPKLDPSSVIWVKLPPVKHTSRHGQKFRLVSWEFCFTECWDCFIMQHCNSRILKGSSFLSNYFVSKLLYSIMLCSLFFTGRGSPDCRELGFAGFWYNFLGGLFFVIFLLVPVWYAAALVSLIEIFSKGEYWCKLHLLVIAGRSGKRPSLSPPCPVDCDKKHCNKGILKLSLVLNDNGFGPIYFCGWKGVNL